MDEPRDAKLEGDHRGIERCSGKAVYVVPHESFYSCFRVKVLCPTGKSAVHVTVTRRWKGHYREITNCLAKVVHVQLALVI
jgi:DUF1365 family protein